MSRNYASVLRDGIAAADAAAAKEAAAAAKAAAAAEKQQTRNWTPQIIRTRGGRPAAMPQVPHYFVEPFPLAWYTATLDAIRTHVGDTMPLKDAPPSSTLEPEWHKYFDRGYVGFGEGANAENNRAGHLALAVAQEEVLKLPATEMARAYDAIFAHQAGWSCQYCHA